MSRKVIIRRSLDFDVIYSTFPHVSVESLDKLDLGKQARNPWTSSIWDARALCGQMSK